VLRFKLFAQVKALLNDCFGSMSGSPKPISSGDLIISFLFIPIYAKSIWEFLFLPKTSISTGSIVDSNVSSFTSNSSLLADYTFLPAFSLILG